MKKISLLALLFSGSLESPSFADKDFDPMPLTREMDENMRMMATTYEKKVAREMQMRAIDLYAMGQALLSHKGHAECQTQGKKLIESAKELYQTSRKVLGGYQVSEETMKDFVDKWTLD